MCFYKSVKFKYAILQDIAEKNNVILKDLKHLHIQTRLNVPLSFQVIRKKDELRKNLNGYY